MKRLWHASIWAPGGIPVEEWKYRNLKRVVLPIFDLLVILAGFYGAKYGVPAVEEFYPASMIDTVSHTFATVGLLCLVAVAFPRLWLMEVVAKSLVIGLLAAYVLSLALLTADGDSTRGFVSVIAVMGLLLPSWRLGILGTERRDRRDEKRKS